MTSNTSPYREGQGRVSGVLSMVNAYLANSEPVHTRDREMLVHVQSGLELELERARDVRRYGRYRKIQDSAAAPLFTRVANAASELEGKGFEDFYVRVGMKSNHPEEWFRRTLELVVFVTHSAGVSYKFLMSRLELKSHQSIISKIGRVRLELEGRFGKDGELRGGRHGGPAKIIEAIEKIEERTGEAHVANALVFAKRLAGLSHEEGPLF